MGIPPQTSASVARRGLRPPAAASSGQPRAAVENHELVRHSIASTGPRRGVAPPSSAASR